MKKVSLLAVLLASVGMPAANADMLTGGCPMAFKGFHLGANLGYGVGYVKHNSESNVGPDSVLNSTKLGVSGIDGGVGTGYTTGCGNWRFGLAFDANWANSSGSHKHLEADGDFFTAKSRLKNSLQLYGKTGYVIGGMTMPFIALGWENAQWKHTLATDAGSVSKSKRVNALMWKAGVDFLATKHVVVGMEYTGSIASRKKIASGEDATAKFKPQYNKFAATVKFVY